jgi:hypothetical protein
MLFGLPLPFPPVTQGVGGGGEPPLERWPGGYRYALRRILSHEIHGMPDEGWAWVFYRAVNLNLRSVANGGHVENGTYRDIAFINVSGRFLDHHETVYNATTGTWAGWVRCIGFRNGVDYTLLQLYGHSGLTASTEDRVGCWDGCSHSVDLRTGVDASVNAKDLAPVGVASVSLLGDIAGDYI